MEPEVTQDTNTPEFSTEKLSVNIKNEEKGTLAPFSTSSGTEQWREVGTKVSEVLSDLPDYVTDFFGSNRRPLVTVGLILGALIAAKLTLALLGAINDIPLLSPLFELIGMTYTAWFVYRYLLKASTRQELGHDFNALKNDILGQLNKES